jgi:hypothetical protein
MRYIVSNQKGCTLIEHWIQIHKIKNGTQDRVPFGRLGDLPQPMDNVSRKEASVNRGGET